jgi:hypothetical protein
MAALPTFCRRLGCTNPKIELLKETDETWAFGCRTCHRVQVVTKPHVKEKVRYEREVAKHRPKHSWDKPRLWFT